MRYLETMPEFLAATIHVDIGKERDYVLIPVDRAKKVADCNAALHTE